MTKISSEEARLRDLRKRTTELQKAIELNEHAIEKCLANIEKLKPWSPIGGPIQLQWHCNDLKEMGLRRQTLEQADQATREIRVFTRLLAYRDEFDPEYEWEPGLENWTICQEDGHWFCRIDRDTFRPGCVYMSPEVAKGLMDKLNSGTVVL